MLNTIKKKIKQTPFWIRLSHSWTYQKYRNPGTYKHLLKEREFYRDLLGDNNSLIFDVGANAGNKALVLSDLTEQIVVFEPSEKMLKILRARFGTNRNFFIEDVALSSEADTLPFYVLENYEAYNTLNTKELAYLDRIGIQERPKVVNVETNTLDYFIKVYGRPDYIKIDVEGYEESVIKGLNTRVDVISFESNFPEFREETINCITHLDKISAYRFNYTINGGPLVLGKFVSATEMIRIVKDAPESTNEIYASLKH